MSGGLFRTRGVRPLLLAEVVSSLGSQMTFLALPWFVLATTGSAAKMGIVLAVELLPVGLLGIPSGSVVARLGARRTMLVGDAARAPLLLAIPLLHAAGLLSFPLLLVCVALIGLFIAPYFSAQRLILPELVGEDERTVAQANAFVEGATRMTSLLGPASAGVLIGFFGATNVLYVDAATFAFAFVVLRFFVPHRPPLAPSEDSRGLFAGVHFLRRDRVLASLLVTALFLNAFGQMLAALRAKVMTAVLTFALLAGPLGLLVVGPLLQGIGVHKVFLVIAAGQTLAALPFALVALRQPTEKRNEVSPLPSTSA